LHCGSEIGKLAVHSGEGSIADGDALYTIFRQACIEAHQVVGGQLYAASFRGQIHRQMEVARPTRAQFSGKMDGQGADYHIARVDLIQVQMD